MSADRSKVGIGTTVPLRKKKSNNQYSASTLVWDSRALVTPGLVTHGLAEGEIYIGIVQRQGWQFLQARTHIPAFFFLFFFFFSWVWTLAVFRAGDKRAKGKKAILAGCQLC